LRPQEETQRAADLGALARARAMHGHIRACSSRRSSTACRTSATFLP